MGAREYAPRTGRWLQRDPIEASSGDPNFWRYCGNDPLNGVDPSGLDWLDTTANYFAGWGDRLTALPDWMGGDSITRRLRRALGADDVVDPCSNAYGLGNTTGAVHDFFLTRGRGGGVRQGFAQGGKKAGRGTDHSIDDLAKAAQQADRGGLTKAGRGLTKHGNRPGSKYPRPRGNPNQINQKAQEIIEDILTDPTSVQTIRHHALYGWVIEVRTASGRVEIRYEREFYGISQLTIRII